MNTVILAGDGHLTLEGRQIGYQAWGCLACRVQLAEGFTLRGFFNMLEVYDGLVALNPFFPTLLDRFRNSPKDGCEYPGFEALELSKTIEMIGFPGDPRLEIYTSLRGIQADQREEIRFLQLSHILDMPLKLGPLKHVVFGDQMDVFRFDTDYSLFEMIEGIGWELSFQGSPEQCSL